LVFVLLFRCTVYFRQHQSSSDLCCIGCVGMCACGILCGALQVSLGTNPLTLAAPGKKDTFELDMATSAVALGKVTICIFCAHSSVFQTHNCSANDRQSVY